MADVLTTSEAGELCGVSFRTVIRWIERGELQGYRLPGRGDHRVLRSELRRFMREHKIPEPEMSQGLPRRILIAEDEPNMARAMSRVLTRAGFKTAVASDGFLTGSLLHTFKPGLLTLDIHMPRLDGYGVLRHLREDPAAFVPKVLVVSAASRDRLDAAVALGANRVLAKPFTNQELLAAVRELYDEA